MDVGLALAPAMSAILAAASALVLLQVGLRRSLRPGLGYGESLGWDALSSLLPPILAGVGAVVLAFVASPGISQEAFAALLLSGLAVGLGGLLLHAWRRWPGLRLVVMGALVVLPVARAGTDFWGHGQLQVFDGRCEKEVAEERERRMRAERPVLRGEPLDEDAAPRYEAAFARLRASRAVGDDTDRAMRRVATGGPSTPVPPAVQARLGDHRAILDDVRVALRCRRCALGLRFEPAEARHFVWLDLDNRATPVWSALVVDGHLSAQAGNPTAAAWSYLEAIRFAADVSTDWFNASMSSSFETAALRSLGRLILSQQLGRHALGDIDGACRQLEATRASVGSGVRGRRLSLGRMEATMERSPEDAGLQEPRILPWLVPYRALAADAVFVADDLLRELEGALDRDDPEAVKRVSNRWRSVASESWSPMRRALVAWPYGFTSHDEGPVLLGISRRSLAWFRLVEAALTLEGMRLATGHFPQQSDGVQLPNDPFSPGAPLHFEAGPRGLRIWSVGSNGVDESGDDRKEADIVLGAEPPEPPSR